jgi:two-component system response regulator FixJ
MAMPDSCVIAVVDDDEPVRISTAGLLNKAGHKALSFASGDAFIAAGPLDDIDCILLDMRMPGMDGLAVMRALRERGAAPAIIVLTGHGDVPLAVEAMRLGAFDFLEKPYPRADLLEAVTKACERPAPVTAGLVIDKESVAKVEKLSIRQRQVLRGILKGQQSKVIAYEMSLSTRTVEAYRAQMLMRLEARGTAEAVRIAIAAGMTAE